MKSYVKLGNKVFNLMSLIHIEFIDKEMGVLIETNSGKHNIGFSDEKEFERFKQYTKLLSTEFDSSFDKTNSDTVTDRKILS